MIAVNYEERFVLVDGRRLDRNYFFVGGIPTVREDIPASGGSTFNTRPTIFRGVPNSADGVIRFFAKPFPMTDPVTGNPVTDVDEDEYTRLAFDWETGTLTGTITVVDSIAEDAREIEVTVAAELEEGGPRLVGTVDGAEWGRGNLIGMLYGPQGSELALAFELDGRYSSRGTGIVYGRTVARR